MAIRARKCLLTGILAVCGYSAASCTGSTSAPAPDFGAVGSQAPPSPAALGRVLAATRVTLAQSAVVSFRLSASQALGSGSRKITGTGQFDLSTSRGRAQLAQLTGSERLIFLPESVFVSQAGGGALLPKGKIWISAGLTEQSLATNFPQFVTQVESLNPALLISEIEWGSVSAVSLPPANGDSAYSVSIDLAKAQTAVSGPSAAAFERAIGYQIIEQSGGATPTLTVDMVVDHQGRVAVLESSPPGAGIGTVTLSLSGWGTPIAVSQPPRAQVVDISSLAPGGERENAGGGDTDGA